MTDDFDDFCLWMYVLVDDIWRDCTPFLSSPGQRHCAVTVI